MVEKLTLDTNLLLEYWKQQDRRHVTDELLALAEAGVVELAISARIYEDIPCDPLAQRIAELPILNVDMVAAPMRVGLGIIGRDWVVDPEFGNYHETAQLIAKKFGAKDGEPNWKDWDHLLMHFMLKRDVFLTWERSILLIQAHMEHRFAIRIMRPEAYLAQRSGGKG